MKYREGYWYHTTEEDCVQLPFACPPLVCAVGGEVLVTEDQRLIIRAGYPWDGASWIWFSWFGTPDTWKTPSLHHDALYEPIRQGVLDRSWRPAVDLFFYHELRARGVLWLVATVAYYCVRIGGNFAVRKTNPVREVV